MACRQSTLRLDLNVRQAIGALLEAGASPVELARLYRCHPATVYRYRANLDLYGDVAPPPPSVQGRPRKITHEAREGMLDWLLENGEDRQLAYRDEIVVFLQEEYSIYVSKWTVGRALREVKLTYKKVTKLPICG
jgi:transposase